MSLFGINKDAIKKAFDEYDRTFNIILDNTKLTPNCDPQMLSRLDALEVLIRNLRKAFD